MPKLLLSSENEHLAFLSEIYACHPVRAPAHQNHVNFDEKNKMLVLGAEREFGHDIWCTSRYH